ncbi:hypothetical protein [Thiohalobacter thiocyanaticus]|uniref:Uncharacterized protein n=1 Tax=Thiohalobacter thiocyanaticus TaxID=585455 RepID=A0A426QKW5_9GAMM|nr:hypothetical protein [Thiohalobacter thiocyanaticus]RRQ22390.1 hypothetical protein D6C00_10795 [Thiohalobacter thiocyanaticus]
MEITLLLKDPPGGRCRLYRAYAEALTEHAQAQCHERFDGLPQQPELQAPAMLIDGEVVIPEDGVLLSPQDIGRTLADTHPEAARLEAVLESTLETCMQEWS